MEGIDWTSFYWLQALVSAAIASGLGVYLFTYRQLPGAGPLGLLMAAVAEWALTYALEFKARGLASKLFWVRLEYLGGAWTGLLLLLFILLLTGNHRWLTPRRRLLLCVVPVVIPPLAWTNDWHHLMWLRAWLDTSGPVPLLVYQRGPAFWVFILFSYLMLIVSTWLLLRTLKAARGRYRRQLQVMLAGVVAPWIANAVYLFQISPLPNLDLTPFAFTISGTACAVALFRHRMIDIMPLAREAIMNGIGDAVLIIDRGGRLIDCNRTARRLMGLTGASLTGDRIERILPRFGPRLRRHLGEDPVQIEIETVFEGGAGCYDLRIFPLMTRSGRRSGWLALVQDITQRRRDQHERERLQRQLQYAQKMEAVGTLAGGVAHDLNNVLSGIVSYPDLLLEKLPGNSPLRQPIETIQASGQKAAAIVQDLLTLARRNVTVNEEVVDLNRIVSEYLSSPEFHKLHAFHSQVDVRTRLSEAPAAIEGMPVQLSKVVMNLVSNAAEAMPDGGVLTLTTAHRHLDTPRKGYEPIPPGRYVVIEVRDTGIGISDANLERIFDPFYTKKKMGRSGTGLGMTVVWGTVKDHNGRIDVTSRPDQGTVFTLYFPATDRHHGLPDEAAGTHALRGRGESVLVVDDTAGQREILTEMLTTLGYRVEAVASGEAAVERVAQTPPDLLILDMVMDPGMDGLTTYEAIIRQRPGQRAILTSGFAEDGRVARARRLGVGQYVRKPYRMKELAEAVHTVLAPATKRSPRFPKADLPN